MTYPLKSENRRLERREDILSRILSGDAYGKVVAMESHERGGRYLEGTGALVLDRANRVAYAALSERCSRELCLEWAEALGYNEVVFFDATDEQGNPVYHTNVVMAVGSRGLESQRAQRAGPFSAFRMDSPRRWTGLARRIKSTRRRRPV